MRDEINAVGFSRRVRLVTLIVALLMWNRKGLHGKHDMENKDRPRESHEFMFINN